MNELWVQVRQRREEALGICSLELVTTDGGLLPEVTAGAHVDVHVETDVVRQYSLCGDPSERQCWRIAVLRDPVSRGGSVAVHERVLPGTKLRVSGPRNHFPLVPAARSILIAGGIGITPLLAMAKALYASRQSFVLHYSARSEARMAFRAEIEAAPWACHTRLYAGDGLAAKRLDATQVLRRPDPATHLYVCGPAGFIDHVLFTASTLGWSKACLHREHFGPAHIGSTPADRAFDVQLARAGQTCHVAADKTVLQALREQGVELRSSCEAGVCGTCLTQVLEGVPDHRDTYLTDAERAANDQFLPCCSRAQSLRLVLDL
jgi:vanillate monooxygenase ferredoxin subunit